jgi:hypothetical protein
MKTIAKIFSLILLNTRKNLEEFCVNIRIDTNFQNCRTRCNNSILLNLIGNFKMNIRTEARRIFCKKLVVGLFFVALTTLGISQPAFSNCKPIDIPLTTETNIPEGKVVQYREQWHQCQNGFWKGTTPPNQEVQVYRQGNKGGFGCKSIDGRLTTQSNISNGTVVHYRGNYHECSSGFWRTTTPPREEAIVHSHGSVDGIRCKSIDLPLTKEANVRHKTVVQYKGNMHQCYNGFWKGVNQPGNETTAGTHQEDDLDAFESSFADDSMDEFETEFANQQAEKRRHAELARIEAERQQRQAKLKQERRLQAEREQARIQEAKRQKEYQSRQEEYYEDEDEDSSSNVWGAVLQGLVIGFGAAAIAKGGTGISPGILNIPQVRSRSYGSSSGGRIKSKPIPKPRSNGHGIKNCNPTCYSRP